MRIVHLLIVLVFALPLAAQTIYYVNPSATGFNNGSSWLDAFTDLQASLVIAQAGDQINVLFYNCLFQHNTGAYSVTSGDLAASYTHLLNCTFVDNSRYVFNKNWNPNFDSVTKYNIMDIHNCVIIDTTALQRIFYNNSFNPFTMHDYQVDNCLLNKPNCLYGGQSVCGETMFYDVDPEFETNTFFPKRCSPLVNAGSNFWPDTFNINTDLVGNARVLFDTVDIGAYEVTEVCISTAIHPAAAEAIFKLLTNPVSRTEPIILISEQPMAETVTVDIFDALGRQYMHQDFLGSDNQVLNLPALRDAGVYWIALRIGSKLQVLRCLVL